MGAPARRLATWEDLEVTPDDGRVYEVVRGSVEAQPRPSPWHSHAQTVLASELVGPFHRGRGGPGGWWLLIEADAELGMHEVVVPDLAGWRRTSLPALDNRRPIRVRPDWICEVASPANRRRDRGLKADLYLSSGVPHYWILDPEERSLEAFEAREGAWVRLGAWTDGDTARIPPFEAVPLEIGGLFPPPP